MLTYAGMLTGLYPQDPLQVLQVDAVLATFEDLTFALSPSLREKACSSLTLLLSPLNLLRLSSFISHRLPHPTLLKHPFKLRGVGSRELYAAVSYSSQCATMFEDSIPSPLSTASCYELTLGLANDFRRTRRSRRR